MKKAKVAVIVAVCAVAVIAVYVLYVLNVLPHRRYSNGDFGIETYMSAVDMDGDGVDDQTDILESVRAYIGTKPKYKSKYYASGYPDDGYGVCTDVVAFGLRGAGYDLMELVNEDILADPASYSVTSPDKKIDFRRVRNLRVYFERTALPLTTDLSKIEEWQGGDIVVFEDHVGVVSDARNRKGVPFLIHHASPSQLRYEEDVLGRYDGRIVGHYRIS